MFDLICQFDFIISGTAALIGLAIAGATAATTKAISAKKNQEATLAAQKAANEQNRTWQLEDRAYNEEMWNKQNEWNSPKHQQQLYSEAGYVYQPNGDVAAANYTPTTTATFQPEVGTGEFSQAQYIGEGVQNVISSGLSIADTCSRINMQQAQTEQIREQTAKMYGEGGYYDQAIANLFKQNTGLDIQNYIAEETKGLSVEQAKIQTTTMNQTFKNLAAAYGGIKANSENMTNMVNEFGTDYWKFIKSHSQSDAFMAQCMASYKKTENEIFQKYGRDNADIYNKTIRAQMEGVQEYLKSARFYNEPEWLNLQTDMLNAQISLTNCQARGIGLQNASWDKVHNKTKFLSSKDGKWYDYDVFTAMQEVEGTTLRNTNTEKSNLILDHEAAGAAYKNGIVRMAADDFFNWSSRVAGVGLAGKFLSSRSMVNGNFGRQPRAPRSSGLKTPTENPMNKDYTNDFLNSRNDW